MTTTLTRPALKTGWLLATVLLGQFMAILDVSIVNVAGPSIQGNLSASGSELQLIVAGYIIAYAMLLITGARLGEMFGIRTIFGAGVTLFTVASLACGLAGEPAYLIAFRLVQGAGAALMVPQVLGVIQRHFDGQGRAKALGLYSLVLAGGAVVGQVVGGVIVSAAGWRPVFLINVPVGIALLIATLRFMPKNQPARMRRLDARGVMTLTPAVSMLVVPLVLGHELSWPAWGWWSLLGSAVLFGVFAHLQRSSVDPLVPGRLLRHPGVLTAAVTIFLSMAGYGGFLFSQALHMQQAEGFSALKAGIAFVPGALAFGLAGLNWRRLPQRWHGRIVPVGLVLTAIGFLMLGPTGARGLFGVGSTLDIVVIGVGLGISFSPALALGLRNVPLAEAGDASGVLAMVTQLGQVVGVAAFGTLYFSEDLTVTGAAIAAVTLLSAAFGLRLSRSR